MIYLPCVFIVGKGRYGQICVLGDIPKNCKCAQKPCKKPVATHKTRHRVQSSAEHTERCKKENN
jgi:hypothetical protein